MRKINKKISGLLLASVITGSLCAQNPVESTGFLDNWYVGTKAGVVSPIRGHAFFKSMRPAFGVEVGKYITPAFALGVEATGYVNTSKSSTAFDHSNISLLGMLNLNNLFWGYNGEPRLFEVETVTGIGWLHGYMNPGNGYASNSLSSKLGFNFNFNLGEQKAWVVSLNPALVYDMNAKGKTNVKFNANQALAEITVGVKYRFKTGNGKHYFTNARLYDQAEVDGLNGEINKMREEIQAKDAGLQAANADLQAANERIEALNKEVTELKNREPQVITETIDNSKKSLESVVTFRLGRTTIDASQYPNVERIASYLKSHADAVVSIKGYASPDGSPEVNERVALQRAEAVKKILISKYGISSARIKAEGQGVGSMFSEPDWNRVSICTIEDRMTD